MTPDKKWFVIQPPWLGPQEYCLCDSSASAQHRRTGDQLGGLPKVEKRGVAKPGGKPVDTLGAWNPGTGTSWYGKYPITSRVSYIFIMPTWLIQLVH